MALLHRQGAGQDGQDAKTLAQAQRRERRGGKPANDRDIDHLTRGLDPTHVKVTEPDAVKAFVLQLFGQHHHGVAVLQPISPVFDAIMALRQVMHGHIHVRRQDGRHCLEQQVIELRGVNRRNDGNA